MPNKGWEVILFTARQDDLFDVVILLTTRVGQYGGAITGSLASQSLGFSSCRL